uniref:Uncharacterized protein n=1 Tax=Kalanchoe fedtschenkoi TaxID=63787 RepID=A0A7N0REX6_KALFE
MMMMGEDFQESDVIFSDGYDSSSSNESNFSSRDHTGSLSGWGKVKPRKQRRQKSGSVPIRIPSNLSTGCSTESDEYDEEEEGVRPPHLIVAKRIGERMGHGRPLRGREMSEVRNSILRMTGFLEA